MNAPHRVIRDGGRALRASVLAACVLPAIACAASAARAGEPAAAFRPDMPLNRWIKVEPKYVGPPEGGRHRPAGWNKLVYDSVGKRMLYMDRWSTAVHGHSIYANAVMAFDVAANTVTCLKLTNWKRQDTAKGGYRTVPLPANKEEPTPCDRHPYGNLAFVPDRNSLYLSTGANRSALRGSIRGQTVTRDTWRYDIDRKKWIEIDETTVKPPGGLEDAMAYDAAHKVIVRICRGRATWLLDV
ncbi:MAG: kelch repeat-containing protein, partial [Planctomycetota bacterium]